MPSFPAPLDHLEAKLPWKPEPCRLQASSNPYERPFGKEINLMNATNKTTLGIGILLSASVATE
jgi:hypothetical protein